MASKIEYHTSPQRTAQHASGNNFFKQEITKQHDEGKSSVYIETPACKPHKAIVIGAINDVVKQQVAKPYCRKRDDERPLFVCEVSGPKKNEGSHRSKIRRMRQQSGEGCKQDNG